MSFSVRLRALSLLFILGFAIIALRLFFWQIRSADSLAAIADAQHFSTLVIPAKRGEILSADNNVLVANQPAFMLYADLRLFKNNPAETAEKLTPLLMADMNIPATDSAEPQKVASDLKENLTRLLGQEGSFWTVLRHNLSRKTKEEIANLKVGGLGFEEEQTRFYPEASMAAQLFGFVGSDENGTPKGYFGLEGYYDRELAGRPGLKKLERDAFNRPIAIGSEFNEPSEDGRSLLTSVDRNVQQIVEEKLQAGMKDWDAPEGTAIVADPYSGKIIAMASFPAYDPANYAFYPENNYDNPAVAEAFEPGSIIKPLIMAAAINEGKVKPETVCDRCAGPRQIEGGIIRTFNNKYHPNTTMTETLENSDNTGMVFVGEKLGKEKLLHYLDIYGFGGKTGIDLQGEEAGTFDPGKDWYPLDLATLTFGQGIAVTAVQMIRGYCALANGGMLVTPQVVTSVRDGDRAVEIKPKIGPRVLSEATTKTIAEMMVSVTEKSPLHFPRDRIAGLSRFKIAAKSGTAQIAIAGHYAQGKTIGSVIGFAPADNPKFLLLVKLNEPAVRPWGSDTAGPIFFAIAHDLLLYYGISP